MGNPLYRNGNIETGNFIIHSQQFLLDMAKEGKEKKKKQKWYQRSSTKLLQIAFKKTFSSH